MEITPELVAQGMSDSRGNWHIELETLGGPGSGRYPKGSGDSDDLVSKYIESERQKPDESVTDEMVAQRVASHAAQVADAMQWVDSDDTELAEGAKSEMERLNRAKPDYRARRYEAVIGENRHFFRTDERGDAIAYMRGEARFHGDKELPLYDHVEGTNIFYDGFHGDTFTPHLFPHVKSKRTLGGPGSGRYPKGSGELDSNDPDHPDNIYTGPIDYYHGTVESALASIAEHGLVPQSQAGADSLYPGIMKKWQIGDRAVSVFLTLDYVEAIDYSWKAKRAQKAAYPDKSSSKPVVLEIRVPQEIDPRVVLDEASIDPDIPEEHLTAYRFKGIIPPEWIHVIQKDKYGSIEEITPLSEYFKTAAAAGRKIYAVFFVDEDLTTAGGPGSGRYPKGSGGHGQNDDGTIHGSVAEHKKLPPGLVKWLDAKRKAKEEAEFDPYKPVWPELPPEPPPPPPEVEEPILIIDTQYSSVGVNPDQGRLEILPRPGIAPIEQTPSQVSMQLMANEIAKRMGHNPELIVVRNYAGRTFELNGVTHTEAGHYSPSTGLIEVNADKLRHGGANGTVVHEIAHAQWDYFKGRKGDEESAMRTRWHKENEQTYVTNGPDDPNHGHYENSFKGERYFTKSGTVRVSKRAEILAMLTYTKLGLEAGLGSEMLGIKPDTEGLFSDDGASDYSAKYWKQAREANPSAYLSTPRLTFHLERAVDETLAEIARRTVPMSEKVGSTFDYQRLGDYTHRISPRFQKLRNTVAEVYAKDQAAVKQYFARRQGYRRR